jgi:hypothetical protein
MGRRRAHFEPGVEPGGELAAVMDDGYRCEAEQEFTDAPNPKNGLAHNASKLVGF